MLQERARVDPLAGHRPGRAGRGHDRLRALGPRQVHPALDCPGPRRLRDGADRDPAARRNLPARGRPDLHAGPGGVPPVRLLRPVPPRADLPQRLRPRPHRRAHVHDARGHLRRAALGQRLLRHALRGLRHVHGCRRRRHLLARAVAGRDGPQVLERRARGPHHHRAARGPAGQRGRDHDVGHAGDVAHPAEGRLLAGHGRRPHRRRRHRRGHLAPAHGRGRLPDHAVPEHLLLGRGRDGDLPHPALLPGHVLRGGDRGPQARLPAAGDDGQVRLGRAAHARLPPRLARAPGDPAGDGPLGRGLGHLGAAGDRGDELHQPRPQRVADPAPHLRGRRRGRAQHAAGGRAARRRRHDRGHLLAHRPGAQGVQPDHVRSAAATRWRRSSSP